MSPSWAGEQSWMGAPPRVYGEVTISRGTAPQPAHCRGRPLQLPSLPCCRSSLSPGSVVEPVAGRIPCPSRPPSNLTVSTGARGPEMGDSEMEETARREMVSLPLPPPEEGRMENLLFAASGTQNISKRAVFSVSGSQEEDSGEPCITGSLPSSLTSRQQ